MIDEELVRHLESRLTGLWRDMVRHRQERDWRAYFETRRSWLQIGRLLSQMAADAQRAREAQLTLLPGDVGRQHDHAS